MRNSPFVLVHGAFQSAGTWDLVASRLQAGGCRTIAATLTGLGTDAGVLSETVTLDTHIRDVVAILEREDLRDVVVVGHSYAGMIITGVAEHVRHRIARLVYIDAFVPEHGQSAMQLLPPNIQEGFRKLAAPDVSWRLRPTDHLLDLWALEHGPARDFVKARLCDFTIRCFEQPLEAPTHAAAWLPRTFIAGARQGCPAKVVFDPFAARAQQEGWPYHELPTGHDPQAEMPDAVSALLQRAAM